MKTVNDLIRSYHSSRHWTALSPSSKRSYSYLIKLSGLADTAIEDINPTYADALYEKYVAMYGPYRASHIVKVLRRLFHVGMRVGLVNGNAFVKMGISALESRTQSWSEQDVAAYYAAASEQGSLSMGVLAYLCYDLCQRPGDMRKLTWDNYNGGIVVFTQEKTKVRSEIPVGNRLRTLLTGAKEYGPMIVSEKTGLPYQERQMDRLHHKIREAAGLADDLLLRDLRRSGATAMAEAGATEDELRAVTGHKSRQVLSVYVRASQKMAHNGMAKRFGSHDCEKSYSG